MSSLIPSRRMATSLIRFPTPVVPAMMGKDLEGLGTLIRVDAAGKVVTNPDADWVAQLAGAWDPWLQRFEVEEWCRGYAPPVIAGPGYREWFVRTTRSRESLGPSWSSLRSIVETEILKRFPSKYGREQFGSALVSDLAYGEVIEALRPGPWESGAQFLEDLDEAIRATE